MAYEEESLPLLDDHFEPDILAEEELADEDEPINRQLISDETVRRCRLLTSLNSVEYGTVYSSPGALLVFSFTFHPFETRFKNARIKLRFDSESETNVVVLKPDHIVDTDSETTELTSIQRDVMHIHGSGVNSDAALWTLEEDPNRKQGILLHFIAAVVLQARGKITIDLDIRAKVGGLLIRKVRIQNSVLLDGRKSLGNRPDELEVDRSTFCPYTRAVQ